MPGRLKYPILVHSMIEKKNEYSLDCQNPFEGKIFEMPN